MSEIDWNDELEAYHEDGRVAPVELDKDYENPDSGGLYTLLDPPSGDGWHVFKSSGESWIDDGESGWRIRNRQPTPSTDRLARLEAFVARVAEGGQMLALGYYEEAKALVAEIAPVDPDVSVAKEMAFDAQDDFVTPLASARLERLERHILSAIKRGRALERGEP